MLSRLSAGFGTSATNNTGLNFIAAFAALHSAAMMRIDISRTAGAGQNGVLNRTRA